MGRKVRLGYLRTKEVVVLLLVSWMYRSPSWDSMRLFGALRRYHRIGLRSYDDELT